MMKSLFHEKEKYKNVLQQSIFFKVFTKLRMNRKITVTTFLQIIFSICAINVNKLQSMHNIEIIFNDELYY